MAFANLCDVNAPTMADHKNQHDIMELTLGRVLTVVFLEPVHTGFSTLVGRFTARQRKLQLQGFSFVGILPRPMQ